MSVYPPDFTTAVGRVRAQIPDIEEIPNSSRPDLPAEYIFSDEHLQAFIDMGIGQPDGVAELLAVAKACDAIAGSEALISKVITTEDLSTDGAKTGNFWLLRAKDYRQQAKDALEDNDGDGFEIVPFFLRPAHTEPR